VCRETRALAEELGYCPEVPPMRTRPQPWQYNRVLYRRRNEVERFFRRLKRFRRIATRYDKLDCVSSSPSSTSPLSTTPSS